MTSPVQQAPQAAAAAAPGFKDPYGAYHFKLVIQGVTEGHFTECSGLGVRVEAIKYREGGTSQVVHRLPGRVDYVRCHARAPRLRRSGRLEPRPTRRSKRRRRQGTPRGAVCRVARSLCAQEG